MDNGSELTMGGGPVVQVNQTPLDEMPAAAAEDSIYAIAASQNVVADPGHEVADNTVSQAAFVVGERGHTFAHAVRNAVAPTAPAN